MLSDLETRHFFDQLCVALGEKDHDKLLLVNAEGNVEENPDFISIPRSDQPRGTSIFLSFNLAVTIHRIGGLDAREAIGQALLERYVDAFQTAHPAGSLSVKILNGIRAALKIAIWPQARPGMDNGEVYLWLKEALFDEDFTIALMRCLWKSVTEKPIMVMVSGASEVVRFYGIGFRFY